MGLTGRFRVTLRLRLRLTLSDRARVGAGIRAEARVRPQASRLFLPLEHARLPDALDTRSGRRALRVAEDHVEQRAVGYLVRVRGRVRGRVRSRVGDRVKVRFRVRVRVRVRG